MKLGELRSAIRKSKGNLNVRVSLAGMVVDLPIQKTPFIKDTLEAYGDSKSAEVDLVFDPGLGLIYEAGGNQMADATQPTPGEPVGDGVPEIELEGGDPLAGLPTEAGDDLLSDVGADLLGGGDNLLADAGEGEAGAPLEDLLA